MRPSTSKPNRTRDRVTNRFQWLQRLARAGLFCACVFALLPVPGNAATYHPISLPAATNVPLSSPMPLPRGDLKDGAVPFKIQQPLPLTGIQDARQGRFFPTEIRGIAIGRAASVLHVLIALDGTEKEGAPFASVVLRYAKGEHEDTRLAYGVHARNLSPVQNEPRQLHDPNSGLIWNGVNRGNGRPLPGRAAPSARLYHTAIPNPRPGEKIVSLDLVSMFSRATPVVLALTAEEGSGGTRLTEPKQNRVTRRVQEFDDEVYRALLTVRAQDANGKPNPDAEAALTISDMDGSYFFGRAKADAAGRIQLPVPPQHAASIAVIVRAGHQMPFVYSTPKVGAGFKREIVATLAPGTEAGGVVQNTAGQPIAGATVTLYHLRQVHPKEYARLDYDTVKTDASGKWKSHAVPASLDGFQLTIGHPDFRPRLFTAGSTAGPGATPLAVEDLRSGQAKVSLDAALLIAGMIRGPADKPVPGAEVRLSNGRSSDSMDDELITRSDANGRFKFAVLNGGSYGVVVLADGFSPEMSNVSVPNRATAPTEANFTLRPGRRFVGRVSDQNQQPIAGAKVRLDGWNDTRLLKFEAETDDSGAFTWTNAPDGQLRFYLMATNHSSTTYSISGNAPEHRFTLRKFSSVKGFVIDAETKKPISDFSVYRGRAYNPGEPIRWERYNTFRGRNGEYNVRLIEYSSSGRTAVLIEAPGYMPVASPEFKKAGLYTNDFALIKARGVNGRVLGPDGTPVAGAVVVLLEPAEYAYLRPNGDLTRNSDSGPQIKSDRNGDFEFPPRLAPHTIVATHDKGFAEVRVTNALAPVAVKLEAWASISGLVKLPAPPGRPHSVRLGNSFYRYADESRESQPLSLYLNVDANPDGSFQFNRVPPGERRVSLGHSIRINDSTRSANSHGISLTLAPGQATNVILGGGGRTIIGRMNVQGAEPEDVDWLRDFHTLNLSRVLNMNLPQVDMSNAKTEEQQQEVWAQRRKLENAFWRTPEGRAYERSEQSYVLQFQSNGTFRVDGVLPGNYMLVISPTDPSRDDFSYDNIGTMNSQVIVPAAKAGEPDAPIDLGALDIAIRGTMRLGKKAPRFTATSFDGKEVKLDDYRGKFVLVDFWATWSGSRTFDLNQLKAVQTRFQRDPRLVMIGMNLDHDRTMAEQELKRAPLPWLQCYGGTWSESTIRTMYGLRGLPDNVLIDADGKIAGFNLRGTAILRTVERFVGPPKNSTP